MGFLDREQRLIQQQKLQREAAEAEEKRLASLAELQKQKEEEDRSHGPEDDEKIEELLGNLPEFNIPAYLALVKKHTGYSGTIGLYTRDMKLNRQTLVNKLMEFGVRDCGYGTDGRVKLIHPKEMFFAQNIHPTKTIIFPLSEPHEPGLGFRFSKEIGSQLLRSDLTSNYTRISTKYVFIRLFLPSTAIITGAGETLAIANTEALDNALEREFKHPHTVVSVYQSDRVSHIDCG